jgi:hypothetical protein
MALGGEAMPGAARPERGSAPSGHGVFDFKNIAFEKGLVSRPIHLIFLEVSASADFEKIVRLSVLR